MVQRRMKLTVPVAHVALTCKRCSFVMSVWFGVLIFLLKKLYRDTQETMIQLILAKHLAVSARWVCLSYFVIFLFHCLLSSYIYCTIQMR
jgi:hypothetical protein